MSVTSGAAIQRGAIFLEVDQKRPERKMQEKSKLRAVGV